MAKAINHEENHMAKKLIKRKASARAAVATGFIRAMNDGCICGHDDTAHDLCIYHNNEV